MTLTLAVRLTPTPCAVWLTSPHHIAFQSVSGVARESNDTRETEFAAEVVVAVANVTDLVPTVQQAIRFWACDPFADRNVGSIPPSVVSTPHIHLRNAWTSASTSPICRS